MKEQKIYIKSAEQISLQEPLYHKWLQEPLPCIVTDGESFIPALNPNFKEYISPLEARRMGKLLKRALVTSYKALENAHITIPDAIITGTGLGCIENTEKILEAMLENGEETMKPTLFMQSTHNTISSYIAIFTHTHGYNITYSHKNMSFDSALNDADTQLRLGRIHNALVGSHDELTEHTSKLVKKTNLIGDDSGQVPLSEASVSVVLDTNKTDALCELGSVNMLYTSSMETVHEQINKIAEKDNIDAIMLGINGNTENDEPYYNAIESLKNKATLLHYKHIFGEGYSASATALYAVAHCIYTNNIQQLLVNNDANPDKQLRNILLINHSDGKLWSFTLLKTLCGK